MDGEVLVHVDLDGVPTSRGVSGLDCARTKRAPRSSTTRIGSDIRLGLPSSQRSRWALGPFTPHPTRRSFGAIGDSAPDRWGRALMRRISRREAEREGRAVRTLREIDCLLMVDDEARQGALRFAEQPVGPFLREPDASRIPPLLELPRLLSAAERIVDEKETDEDLACCLRLLFARRRPPEGISGLKDGSLAIAKFPRRDDEINVVAWEAVALTLARKAGIATPAARLEDVAGNPYTTPSDGPAQGKRVQQPGSSLR